MLFTHPQLGEEVHAISGHYVFTREECVEIHGRKMIYLAGYAVADGSCCGNAGCGYAVVAGFVVSYRTQVNCDGMPVSLVEPVEERFHKEIAEALQAKEYLQQVHFLCESGGSKVLF